MRIKKIAQSDGKMRYMGHDTLYLGLFFVFWGIAVGLCALFFREQWWVFVSVGLTAIIPGGVLISLHIDRD